MAVGLPKWMVTYYRGTALLPQTVRAPPLELLWLGHTIYIYIICIYKHVGIYIYSKLHPHRIWNKGEVPPLKSWSGKQASRMRKKTKEGGKSIGMFFTICLVTKIKNWQCTPNWLIFYYLVFWKVDFFLPQRVPPWMVEIHGKWPRLGKCKE